MQLKNYQEDLVLNIIEIVLRDRPDIESSESFVRDVAAYTLNRIPPRYLLSERGFTRLVSKHLVNTDGNGDITELVKILLLVNKAIDLVRSRRRLGGETAHGETAHGETAHGETAGDAAPPPEMTAEAFPELGAVLTYWHNFPCLFGRVIDESSRRPVYDVEVTLFLDGEKSSPAQGGWHNPYLTNSATQGLFSFMPQAVRSREEKLRHTLEISLRHPDYHEIRIRKRIQTLGEFDLHLSLRAEHILDLGTSRLSALTRRGD